MEEHRIIRENHIEGHERFDVWLESYGVLKICSMKMVGTLLDIGLKEAKDLVESAPVLLMGNASLEAANAIVERFDKIKAEAVIKPGSENNKESPIVGINDISAALMRVDELLGNVFPGIRST